ncbi:hypothetical protein BGZ70_010632 [Mortierella alpina]|uniref:Uncharacterized protein n=1 Tax=Mortierella alpina TaxID=64518 RepID=A0A9P6LYG4_MORAP|nr:hypothetical protein BGZ70_010632 [Mortierella alpina]
MNASELPPQHQSSYSTLSSTNVSVPLQEHRGYVGNPPQPYRNDSNISGSLANQKPFENHYHDHQDEETPSSQPLHLEGQTLKSSSVYYITPPGKALVLQTLTTLSTIVFTVLPVVIKAGTDATWGSWYSWRDACRFIEPFCSGLLHTWFFYSSDLMRPWTQLTVSPEDDSAFSLDKEGILLDNRTRLNENHDSSGPTHYAHNSPAVTAVARTRTDNMTPNFTPNVRSSFKETTRFKSLLSAVFMFFLIVYVTGAAIHTAAAFFKNTIALFLEQYSQGIGLSTHPPTMGDGQLSLALALQLKEGYLLIQDVWEHTISHYLYAFGALGMSWCEMIAYSSQILPQGVNLARVGHLKKNIVSTEATTVRSSKRLVVLWVVAGVLYGGIVAGVACQYPKGLYVGLAYVACLLLVVSAYILLTPTRGLFSLGRHYILQTYLIGGVVAAVAIISYMAKNRFDMLTSNDKSHNGSVNRP